MDSYPLCQVVPFVQCRSPSHLNHLFIPQFELKTLISDASGSSTASIQLTVKIIIMIIVNDLSHHTFSPIWLKQLGSEVPDVDEQHRYFA